MSMIAIPLCDGFFESPAENTSRFPSGDQTGWLAFRSLRVTCRRPVPSGLMMNAPASCCGFPRVDVNASLRPSGDQEGFRPCCGGVSRLRSSPVEPRSQIAFVARA